MWISAKKNVYLWHEKLRFMKQHIHITLVGGQRIPVIVGIGALEELDHLVVIHSKETIKEAQIVAKVLGFDHTELLVWSSSDLREMAAHAEHLFERYREERVTLNLTGGLKPWSWALQRAFANHPNAELIYVDQNNRITNLQTLEVRVGNPISIAQRFQWNGIALPTYRNLKDYSPEDLASVAKLERLQRSNPKVFNRLNLQYNAERDKRVGEVYYQQGESYLAWDKDEHKVIYRIIDKFDKEHYEEFKNPLVFEIALNYAWFELKTAMELSKNERVQEIWLNCVFNAQSGQAKNEIDVIADMGTKLVFVECKTMIYDTTDLDKFANAFKNYSGTGSKGIFVSQGVYNNNVRTQVLEKCGDSKLLTFNYADWKKKGCPEAESLNAIINRELDTQNTR